MWQNETENPNALQTDFQAKYQELSIQTRLNGFSFLVTESVTRQGQGTSQQILTSGYYPQSEMHAVWSDQPAFGNDAFRRVFAGCATERVLLIPHPVFEPHRTEQYLKAANLFTPGMSVFSNTIVSAKAVAVWQMDSFTTGFILDRFPEALFYHPLQLELDHLSPRHIHIYVEADQAHTVICDNDLAAAESFTFRTPLDLLYVVRRLTGNDGNYSVTMTGHVDQRFAVFGEWFSRLDIHNDPYYPLTRIRQLCALLEAPAEKN